MSGFGGSGESWCATSAAQSAHAHICRRPCTLLVMADLLDDDLSAIESRAHAATPGPWKAFVEGRDHLGGDDFIRTGGSDDSSPDLYVSLAYSHAAGVTPAGANDLDFIASARQDIPRLVAEVRRLRAVSSTSE